jgi:GalNAc-alpha-(1->4)-GalNAc-alpha-(1->3)-diNAcBac-PP-undecaprenol alpha-1,4-N-acetyl-D-galactosaminyltransferase
LKAYLVFNGRTLSGGGGAERRFLRLFERLKKDTSIDITLVINRSLYTSASELELLNSKDKVSIYEEDNLLKMNGFFMYVIKRIIKEKPDVIHLVLIQKSHILLYVFLFLFRKPLNIKVVGTVASYLFAKNIKLSFFEKVLYRLFIGCSDQIDSLYPSIIFKSDKISISPGSFTDYDKFKPREKENIIVFAGRLISEKNPKLFIESINEIINIRKNKVAKEWRYYIMGEGPLKKNLIEYVNKQGLDRYITFTSGDTSNILSVSKIFMSLQPYDNYPSQSVLEAIASKNYIVATDVGDTRRFLSDEFSHLIQPSITSLSDALIEIINNDINFDIKVEQALKFTKEHHNIDVFSNYIIGLWKGNSKIN